jgi:hypothetical protein
MICVLDPKKFHVYNVHGSMGFHLACKLFQKPKICIRIFSTNKKDPFTGLQTKRGLTFLKRDIDSSDSLKNISGLESTRYIC